MFRRHALFTIVTLGALTIAPSVYAQRPGGAGGPGGRGRANGPAGAPNGARPMPGGMPGAMRGGMRGAMPGAMGGPAAAPRGSAAQEFLAHTGELNLTDQQVVRLAAIARRAHQRDLATRAAMDSARALRARTPRDSAQPRPMRFDSAAVARALAARQTDLRDALAVLTPDQQATAWQTIAPNRGRGMRQAFGARGRRSGPARPRGPER